MGLVFGQHGDQFQVSIHVVVSNGLDIRDLLEECVEGFFFEAHTMKASAGSVAFKQPWTPIPTGAL